MNLVRRIFRSTVVGCFGLAWLGSAAFAGDWQTWSYEGECFAAVSPSGPPLKTIQTKQSYLSIKHIPLEKNFDNIVFVAGLEDVVDGSTGTVTVNDEDWPLLVFNGAGFVRSGDPERKLLTALMKGGEVKVSWQLKDGFAVQSYNVDGLPDAKRIIDLDCKKPPQIDPLPVPDTAPIAPAKKRRK